MAKDVSKNKLTEQDKQDTKKRIATTSNLDDFSKVDIVIEVKRTLKIKKNRQWTKILN